MYGVPEIDRGTRIVEVDMAKKAKKAKKATSAGTMAVITLDSENYGSGTFTANEKVHRGDYQHYVAVFDHTGKPIDGGEAIFDGRGSVWVAKTSMEDDRPAGTYRKPGRVYEHALWVGGDALDGRIVIGTVLGMIAGRRVTSVRFHLPSGQHDAEFIAEINHAMRGEHDVLQIAEMCQSEQCFADVTLSGQAPNRFRIGPDRIAHQLA
jgi:hypothetical protein